VFGGASHSPDEALRRGFVQELVDADRLLERACEVARQMGTIPPGSFALTKAAMRRPFLDAVSAETERQISTAWNSPEVRDAIRAYVDRTIPRRK